MARSAGLAAGASGAAVVLAASDGMVTGSSLKSPGPGGGRLAGSGRGTAASIASSAALLRGVLSPCASAELADTARKVAATVISTRSYPVRFFQQSRILTPLRAEPPCLGAALIGSSKLSGKRRPDRRPKRRHGAPESDSARSPLRFIRQRYTRTSHATSNQWPTHDKLTSPRPVASLCLRSCHASCHLSVTCRQRFKTFPLPRGNFLGASACYGCGPQSKG